MRATPSRAEQALIGVVRTADLFMRLSTGLLEAHGLTPQQYNVLRILRGAGGELPTLDVADRLIEQTPGITRLLDRLEAKGLVRRQRCPKDRRRHLCRITDEGTRLLDTLDVPVVQSAERCLKGLNRADQQALVTLLDRARAAHA